MKIIMTFIVLFLFASPSFAATISEKDVKVFLDNWLAAQNTGSFQEYAQLYAKKFTGIRRSGTTTRKLDREAWIKERKQMFRSKIRVIANNPEIKLSNTTALISFEQTWESGSYKDKGIKHIELVTENGKLKISREEMLFSNVDKKSKTIQSRQVGIFYSLDNKDCKKINSSKLLTSIGSEIVFECQAPKGWRLFKVIDNEEVRSWIVLSKGGSMWTTIKQVWNDEKYEFGYFPNIDNSPAEWTISENKTVISLIFRVKAQDKENSNSIISRYFTISLTNNVPKFCGITKTNAEAKLIASNINGSIPCFCNLDALTP